MNKIEILLADYFEKQGYTVRQITTEDFNFDKDIINYAGNLNIRVYRKSNYGNDT